MIKKNSLFGCVVRVVYFVNISICDALSQFNDDACKVKVSRLNSRNKNKENFHWVQKLLLLINLPQITQEAVLNVEITGQNKNI